MSTYTSDMLSEAVAWTNVPQSSLLKTAMSDQARNHYTSDSVDIISTQILILFDI